MNFALLFGNSVNVFAQPTTPNPSASPSVNGTKRNSPFSPNPKKKAENNNPVTDASEAKTTQVQPSNQNGNGVEIVSNNENTAQTKNENKTEVAAISSANRTRQIVEEASKTFAPTEIYRVGSGDVLDIRILNANSKESTLFTVQDNGFLDYPLAGSEPIQIGGLTTDQIEKVLRENIKLYENPEVVVKIRDYQSHTVDVIGLVEKPGKKALRREAIPLFALKVEAIVQPKATILVLRRGDQVEKHSLKDQATDNLLIKTGDILEFTYQEEIQASQTQQFYYTNGKGFILGGEKPYRQGITLLQAITASGGLKKENTKEIIVRRKNEEGKLISTKIDLQAIKNGQSADYVIQAGDIIEVVN